MKQTPFMLAREVSATRKETVFLASGRFLLRWLFCFVGLAMPFVWLSEGRGWANLVGIMVTYLAVMIVGGVPMTLLMKWFSRVRSTGEGIHGGTIWGTPVYMTFAEMEAVEPRSLFGMPYLRVKSFRESCPALWIPRFLADPAAFQRYITEHTSPAHPLRRSLENGNTSQRRHPLAI